MKNQDVGDAVEVKCNYNVNSQVWYMESANVAGIRRTEADDIDSMFLAVTRAIRAAGIDVSDGVIIKF